MDIYSILYLSLLSLSLVLSIWCFKSDKNLKVFIPLLSISLLTEIIVYTMHSYGLKPYHNIVYHVYIPLEYIFLNRYFYGNLKSAILKRSMLVTLIVFVISSVVLSVWNQNYLSYPGKNLNLEGVLLIIWSTIALFNIDVTVNLPIYRLPIFWICMGLLVFCTGGFAFNELYEYLGKRNQQYAYALNVFINKNLNIILYICFSIAFICSHLIKKYPSRF